MKNTDPHRFIQECSTEMKKIKEIKPPDWSVYAKTGPHRKYSPKESDWWYTRAASVLRKIAMYGPIGVPRLRVFYGGKKDRGHKPEHFVKSGGGHLRMILQQLESAGLVEKSKGRPGRVLTSKGEKFVFDVLKR